MLSTVDRYVRFNALANVSNLKDRQTDLLPQIFFLCEGESASCQVGANSSIKGIEKAHNQRAYCRCVGEGD